MVSGNIALAAKRKAFANHEKHVLTTEFDLKHWIPLKPRV